MRIIGGTAKGRRIGSPRDSRIRPTTDRVREAVFNALYSRVDLDGETVLDAFAGTGAFGFEALSRGASGCTFIDSDRRACDLVRHNADELGFANQSTILLGDALAIAPRLEPVAVAFCDPPYAFDRWDDLLAVLRARVVVAESSFVISGPESWEVVRSRRYGSTVVTVLQRNVRYDA